MIILNFFIQLIRFFFSSNSAYVFLLLHLYLFFFCRVNHLTSSDVSGHIISNSRAINVILLYNYLFSLFSFTTPFYVHIVVLETLSLIALIII